MLLKASSHKGLFKSFVFMLSLTGTGCVHVKGSRRCLDLSVNLVPITLYEGPLNELNASSELLYMSTYCNRKQQELLPNTSKERLLWRIPHTSRISSIGSGKCSLTPSTNLAIMGDKGPGGADLGNMGAFDFSALQGVLNVSFR